MLPQDVHRFEQRIQNLINKADQLIDDQEVLAHWARYLCVLVSGYIEVSASSICSEYAIKRADPSVYRYVDKRVSGFQNGKMEKFLQLFADFDTDFREKIEEAMPESAKDAFDSIVNNRHQIAHGKDVGITLARVVGFYVIIKETVHKTTEIVIPD